MFAYNHSHIALAAGYKGRPSCPQRSTSRPVDCPAVTRGAEERPPREAPTAAR
eukprot:CAMPEP_0195575234 /NCGR_PEP_ID=MMETSP0814-20130614/6527_1 /TAXON_ID=97485 /ORGANISM="Prymnesium parvum, Strain Texoma1" /LENGTH=52 /DNA_ID=CAMNT_0040711327 /DNA_START=121 /DNA_END=275 /DNA_ORIENTATION=-